MASASPSPPPRRPRIRDRFSPRERASIGGMTAFVVLLHIVGWGVLIWVVASQQSAPGAQGAFGLGLGVAAYTLGLRHAFDADHISAIDNTTRHLMHHGDRPLLVGFWFALGHSTVVFGLCAAVAAGMRQLMTAAGSDSARLQDVLSVAGAGISGLFLYAIGISNLVILLGIIRVFRQARSGVLDESALETALGKRGLVSRFFGGAGRLVRRPAQIYTVGLLFGLGLDTAAEVGLLVLAGGAAALALPWYAVLTLPVLFAAGMSLLDSLDGCFMNFAYGWALARPVRKLYYNIVVTAISVTVALAIGSVQLLSILAGQTGASHGPLAGIARLDLGTVGYAIAAIFALSWIGAVALWRWGRIEERWLAAQAAEPDRAGGQRG